MSQTPLIRAILGPTNTGKTHLAVERLLAHGTGMIGLPLRLLAREVYDRMVAIKGEGACALITGEERIRPPHARYFACTVEAMPISEQFDFVAVDEVQLGADPDRGHVFTDRILRARGVHETMLLGSDIIRPALSALDLKIDPEHRERFSKLGYGGHIKITKLPKRSAVVAFSAEEVYAIAELLKRQRGGCAVIMGALSPRTRNAQVALYQSGEVDYIVATDAIGMGLNLDVAHIAFASRRKFDGRRRRDLRADEMAQIAGRAGRFRDDGTFGETADCRPIDQEIIDRICDHRFEPLDHLSWRNSDLEFSTLDRLIASLKRPSPHPVLRRAPEALDENTLVSLAQIPEVRQNARSEVHVRRLWDLCTLPDFRKSGEDAHIRLVSSFAEQIMDPEARIKDEWVYSQVERLDQPQGDIDTLQQRLASIRTWTYAANRSDWLENAETWRNRTRSIEDRLSDALHEGLMQRFVDRRTSALLKALSADSDIATTLDPDGSVLVEGHRVGELCGLTFTPDTTGQTLEGRSVRNAALKALTPIIEQKLAGIASAESGALSMNFETLEIIFEDCPIARLSSGPDWLAPRVDLVGAIDAETSIRQLAVDRVQAWLENFLKTQLAPIFVLKEALEGHALSGLARGVAFQLTETGASVDRRANIAGSGATATAPGNLSHAEREALKTIGVRGGRIAAWLPALLKPSSTRLLLALRGLADQIAAPEIPTAASFALTNVPGPGGSVWTNTLLWCAGYIRLGPRAVRADMAERLSWQLSQIRKASETSHFETSPELAAIIGCPSAEFPEVLKSLGLKPAERNKETGGVSRWRFAGKSKPEIAPIPRQSPRSNRPTPSPAPPPSGPFAALAEHALARKAAAPTTNKRRRKRPARKDPAARKSLSE